MLLILAIDSLVKQFFLNKESLSCYSVLLHVNGSRI